MIDALNEPDTWIRVQTDEWLTINLRFVHEVDWKPGAVILCFHNGSACEVPETNRHYQTILDWLAKHGEKRP